MSTDSRAWRCPVCDGVNHGGRVCTTCGEELPEGFVPRDATPQSSPAGETPTVVPVVRRPPPSAPRSAPPAPPRPTILDDIFGLGGRSPFDPASWLGPAYDEPTYEPYEPVDEPETPAPRRRGGARPASFDDVFGSP